MRIFGGIMINSEGKNGDLGGKSGTGEEKGIF